MTNAAPPLADATRAFLRRHAPFVAMADDALDWAIPRLSLVYFPKDATILTPASGPVEELHLIQRGRVGSRPDDHRAEPDPTLGPGELFPVGALSAAGPTTKIFHAAQDTFCYVLPRDDFMELRRRFARARAVLHAGDHRDAEGLAGPACRPVRSARRGAASLVHHFPGNSQ